MTLLPEPGGEPFPTPPAPDIPPVKEPDPDRLPDETPVPNPDENPEPPLHVAALEDALSQDQRSFLKEYRSGKIADNVFRARLNEDPQLLNFIRRVACEQDACRSLDAS